MTEVTERGLLVKVVGCTTSLTTTPGLSPGLGTVTLVSLALSWIFEIMVKISTQYLLDPHSQDSYQRLRAFLKVHLSFRDNQVIRRVDEVRRQYSSLCNRFSITANSSQAGK